jgi:hypothetical protein
MALLYMDKEIKRIKKMKPSAYKSMMLGKVGLSKTTPQKKKDLIRWKNEKWENLTAKITDGDKFYACGQKGKKQIKKNMPSVCRASVKINNKTPKPLSKDVSNKQIKKAVEIKKKGKRIDWSKL